MSTVSIGEIDEGLRRLPPHKLAVVRDFVEALLKEKATLGPQGAMLVSEAVLRRDWDRPEEDQAWASL